MELNSAKVPAPTPKLTLVIAEVFDQSPAKIAAKQELALFS